MSTVTPPIIERGEIWDVEFDPQLGAEIGKIRPAVVSNIPTAGRLPLRIVVPITTSNPTFKKLFWMVPIPATTGNGLDHASFADAFQVKSVSMNRFVSKWGNLEEAELDEIAAVIAHSVG